MLLLLLLLLLLNVGPLDLLLARILEMGRRIVGTRLRWVNERTIHLLPGRKLETCEVVRFS